MSKLVSLILVVFLYTSGLAFSGGYRLGARPLEENNQGGIQGQEQTGSGGIQSSTVMDTDDSVVNMRHSSDKESGIGDAQELGEELPSGLKRRERRGARKCRKKYHWVKSDKECCPDMHNTRILIPCYKPKR